MHWIFYIINVGQRKKNGILLVATHL